MLTAPAVQRRTHGGPVASSVFETSPSMLGAHDIEIAISHCGLSRSHHDQETNVYSSFPIVPDMGVVGTITGIGKKVTQFRLGDRAGVSAVVSPCQDKSSCRACANDDEAKCERLITTYGDSDNGGPRPFGGYTTFVHVDARHAVKIPDALPSEAAAPLFCAGAAAHKPLKEHVKPGHVVGVVGIGALGHLALQFILALEATPIAFSTSPEKEESVRWLGADDFINTNNHSDVKRAASMVDVLLVTSQAPDQPCHIYADWVKPGGVMIVVGECEDELVTAVDVIVAKGLTVVSSKRGNISDTMAMLELAADVGVRPVVESFPMDEASRAFARLDKGVARYLVVLRTC